MKLIVVTGSTAGIGLRSAEQLGGHGHHLVLIGRSRDRLAAAATLVRAAGAAGVDTHLCDFASLAEVERVAEVLLDAYDRIDVLINNAGGLFPRRTTTKDGYEATFAVNHLAGYLLTERLKPLIVSTASARIVITSSSGHYRGSMDFDDLQFERNYNGFKAYYRSKLANVLYMRALASELLGDGVSVNALHPGAIATDIWDNTSGLIRPIVTAAKRLVMLPPAEGGARITHLAIAPEVSDITGTYFDRNRVKEPSKLARDATVAQRLCAASDQLAGIDRHKSF